MDRRLSRDGAEGIAAAVQQSDVECAQQYIAEQISIGALKPGDKVVEAQIARALHMSRTPVREALARLEAEGVVESRYKQGAVVARVTRADLVDMYDIRILLEAYGARAAASNITLDELTRAQDLIATIDEVIADTTLTSLERALRVAGLNSQFHSLIATASRNRLLPSMLRPVVRTFLSFTLFRVYTLAELQQSNDQHRVIARSLAERDPGGAERAMQGHVRTGLNVLLREFPQG
jgi:DNA-binding GntR family transcriptional regulator